MRSITFSFFLLLLGVLFLSFSAFPPLNSSGATGEMTCLNCHGGEQNPASGFASLNIGDNQFFETDSNYDATFKIVHTGHSLFGFSITPSKYQGKSSGSFRSSSESSKVYEDNQTTMIGHQNAYQHISKDSMEWRFEWTAPAENLEVVTFYYTGRSLNETSNDMAFYRDSIKLFNRKFSSAAHHQIQRLQLSPNPLSPGEYVTLGIQKQGCYKLYDSQFKQIGGHLFFGTIQAPLSAGLYWLYVECGEELYWARFMVK